MRLNVAAFSCITIWRRASAGKNLSHAEVLETAGQAGALQVKMLKVFCGFYGQNDKRRFGAGGGRARERAVGAYSKFKVGAALLAKKW